MADAALLDLVADRDLWFVSDPLVFLADLTSATFRMQVRLTPDAAGTPLASLTTVTTAVQGVQLTYSGTDTVANHVAAGRLTESDAAALGYADTDSLLLSILVARINNTTMAAMPPAVETGDDVVLAYDLLVTLPPNPEDKWLYGSFTIRGTVTQ